MSKIKQIFSAKTKTKDIPVEAFSEIPLGAAQFAGQDSESQGKFSLMLYDGKSHFHWYWGNLAFDLTGMTMLKKVNPVLWGHNRDQVIGVSSVASFDGKFVMEGEFLEASEKAAEIQSNAKQGLVYESSLSVDSDAARVEFIREGATGEVNGIKVKGPGTIFRECKIREGSIVLFGALRNSKSNIFIESERDVAMDIKEFEKQHPDLFKEVSEAGKASGIADAKTQGPERFKAVLALVDDDKELAADCFAAGLDDVGCLQKKTAKLTVQLKAEKEKPPVVKLAEDDPADLEFSDNETNRNAAAAVEGDENFKNTKDLTDVQLTERFDKSKKLQDEFGSDELGKKSYLAFCRSKEKGTSKIFGKE